MIRNNALEEPNKRELVLDARSTERWAGTAPEPRKGMSSGHMPHSSESLQMLCVARAFIDSVSLTVSLPFPTLLASSDTNPPYQYMLPPSDLKKVVEKAVGGSERLQAISNRSLKVTASCVSSPSYLCILDLLNI